jgi:hypothetical protein
MNSGGRRYHRTRKTMNKQLRMVATAQRDTIL